MQNDVIIHSERSGLWRSAAAAGQATGQVKGAIDFRRSFHLYTEIAHDTRWESSWFPCSLPPWQRSDGVALCDAKFPHVRPSVKDGRSDAVDALQLHLLNGICLQSATFSGKTTCEF
jgi:hypothetical protein